VLENPEAGLDDLMEHMRGPDFPTHGLIMGRSGIRAAYATGRGSIQMRARCDIEEIAPGRQAIIVSELPYQVNKARLIETIADQWKDKRHEGIARMHDASDRDGMRIVIEMRRDANPQVVLNRLFSSTQLQTTFAVVMLAIVDDRTQPRILSLRQILDEYIAFQREVIRRRSEFELKKARERAHLLEGLRIAVDNIDEIVRIIRTSYNDARENLMARFDLSEVQANAILEMQLRRIQGLEREKIEAEYKDIQEKIAYLIGLLSDMARLDGVLKDELREIRDKYGDDRRTEIVDVEDEIDIEDLIDEEECVYTLTRTGYIKRQPASTYRTQRRGGRGITAMQTRDEDFVETIFTASTHDYILFFTNYGRTYRKKGYQIPEAGRQAKGTNLVNLIPVSQGERVTAMIKGRGVEDKEEFLVMVTRGGTVKRMETDALRNIRNSGIRAITLDEGDELISVRETDGEQMVLIATHDGMAICFSEGDLRPMGRNAAGVRGIRLREGDYCVGAARARDGGSLLTVTEKGYGKRTAISEYLRGGDEDEKSAQSRGGIGRRNYHITDKTGKVAAVKVVDDNDDVLIISDDGTVIRMSAAGISTYGRATQGVRLMRIGEDARVISIARTDKTDADADCEADADADAEGDTEGGAVGRGLAPAAETDTDADAEE
jgi:DNA gyrase subunit A